MDFPRNRTLDGLLVLVATRINKSHHNWLLDKKFPSYKQQQKYDLCTNFLSITRPFIPIGMIFLYNICIPVATRRSFEILANKKSMEIPHKFHGAVSGILDTASLAIYLFEQANMQQSQNNWRIEWTFLREWTTG